MIIFKYICPDRNEINCPFLNMTRAPSLHRSKHNTTKKQTNLNLIKRLEHKNQKT